MKQIAFEDRETQYIEKNNKSTIYEKSSSIHVEVDKCSMSKDPGHRCYAEDSSTRWYYNKMSKTCLPFSYGGCGGNENNFDNAYDCHKACGGGVLRVYNII